MTVFCFRWKQNTREVLSSSRLDARWLRPPPPFKCFSLVFLFLLALHTDSETIELDIVFAKLLISWKSPGGLDLFLLRFTRACSKRAFKLSITILGQEMKARTFVCSTPPLRGLPLTWESLKVMPVNQIHQSKWRERQRWPRSGTHRRGVFMTGRVEPQGKTNFKNEWVFN